jgi:hypothetical protein
MKEAVHVNPNVGSATKHLDHIEGYYLFNLSGGRKKVKVLLSNILLVCSVKSNNSDKLLYLKNNVVHKIRGCSLNKFIAITGFLLQVNKHDLVSPEVVESLDSDCIYLSGLVDKKGPKYVTLNRTYKRAFLNFFHYDSKE